MASPSRRTEPIAFEAGWTSLSGRILAGGFELQEILAADEWQANLKVRVLGDRELDCAAHCFRLPPDIAEAQVALWQITRELRHPNLSAPLGAGILEIEGEVAAYAVVRRADESLNSVLAERALTIEETREALRSVARGLEALHVNDLAHGCLSPSQVLAVGDAIKLPVGCVRAFGVPPSLEIQTPAYLAPESSGENLTAEADLWCLGATLFEALTQNAWTENLRDQLDDVPEPFATIACRCLETDPGGRATLGEVVALLSGQLKPTPRVKIAPAPIVVAPDVPAPAEFEPAAQADGAESLPAAPRVYVQDIASVAPGITTVPNPAKQTEPTPSGIKEPQVLGTPALVIAPMPLEAAPTPATLSPTAAKSDTASAAPIRKSDDVRPTLVARPRWEDVVGRDMPADNEEERASSNLWIWAVVALLVVVGLIWILRPKPATTARVTAPLAKAPAAIASGGTVAPGQTTTKQSSGKSNELVKPASTGWETRTLQPDGTAPSSPRASVPSSAANVGTAPIGEKPGAEQWRLVLYTYRTQEDAKRKANSLNSSHEGLHCEVFSPSGSGGPYLVVAGRRMSRDQATQLRRKAMGMGMPRDSYIQNYKH